MEGGTPTLSLRLHPDPAAMHLDDAPGKRQPNAGSPRAGVELLEQFKYPVVVTRVDPLPVIPHVDHLLISLPSRANLDHGLLLLCGVDRRILDQILKDLAQADAVPMDRGQVR